jgi:hypothetical protein
LNRLRVQWGLNREKGRPRGSKATPVSKAELVKVTPNLGFVGVHILDDWMEQQGGFHEVMVLLKRSIEVYQAQHPQASFPLLHHREQTLLLRFKALFYAPLMGIGKLTEYDVKEHCLETLIGRGYQSSTLNQYLGQLECIEAGDGLMEALLPPEPGTLCYVDGHMIAFWTTASMHKGKITMLGRIMAGSQAVVAHNENGHALLVDYYPPDIRLPRMILDYCQRIVTTTGIELFVIDREVNSVAMAQAFEQKGWGLLSMLDRNEYKGLSDWKTEYAGKLEDGSPVYTGKWRVARDKDQRIFVIVQVQDRLVVYWGTSKVKEMLDPVQWPAIYRDRVEIQENSFKRMIDHGALNVNYGIKKIVGPDRHQERAVQKLETQLEKRQEKVEKKEQVLQEQQEKVKESEEKGHGKRLLQRQRRLAEIEKELREVKKKEKQIEEKIQLQGEPRQREDRDFRKQTIMSFRTLFLENALTIFLATLLSKLDISVGVDTVMALFFRRSGAYLETPSEIIYKLNTAGLSSSNKEMLSKIAQGLTEMGIRRRGKPIKVQLREAPS